MRQLLTCVGVAVLFVHASGAQTPAPAPVRWSLTLTADARVEAGGRAVVLATATIDPGWHLYAMSQPPGGPIAMTIMAPKGQPFSLDGKVHEPEPAQASDRNFNDLTTRSFDDFATFTVPVRVTAGTKAGRHSLRLSIEYQACTNRLCLPPVTVEPGLEIPVNMPSPPKPPDLSNPDEPSLSVALAARATPDPEAKLAALARVRQEFAGKPVFKNFYALLDESALTTLYRNFPERVEAIDAAFVRAVESQTRSMSPGYRLERLVAFLFQVDVVNEVIERRLILSRIESTLDAAIAAVGDDKGHDRALAHARRARIAYAKGLDAEGAARYQLALVVAPDIPEVATELVSFHLKGSREAKAREVTRGILRDFPGTEAACAAVVTLAEAMVAGGNATEAEKWLGEAVAGLPRTSEYAPGDGAARALLALARLEARRGANVPALRRYMLVAAASEWGVVGADDLAAMRALYRKVHDSDDGLDDALDALAKPMNPVKAVPYRPAKARSTRTVLVEQFSGTGCGPCIGSSLAIDAILERYRPSDVVVLTYHASIPPPDPLVVAAGQERQRYYRDSFSGVPSLFFDGAADTARAAGFGGPREDAQWMYDVFSENIDKALQVAPAARVNVRASLDDDLVRVQTEVAELPASRDNLRVHVVLAEREVRYGAENGIRWHSMVVRGAAGENGGGLPIKGTGALSHTFSLAAIKKDVVATLAAEVQQRRERRAANGAEPRVFYAERHAVAAIDPTNLIVVAFVQDSATRRVLQAVQAPVELLRAGSGKGGAVVSVR